MYRISGPNQFTALKTASRAIRRPSNLRVRRSFADRTSPGSQVPGPTSTAIHSSSRNMVKVVVGMMGSSVAAGSTSLSTPEQVSDFLSAVKASGIVNELDTARVYNGGRSEELLGMVASARQEFAISTKAPAWAPGSLSEAKIKANCAASLAALRQQPPEGVDIYYLHGPDRTVPFEEQCRAIGQLYREGAFKRFGVSNLTSDDVRKIHDICSREGYVLPTVYQGGYSPLARQSEASLLPTLRELNIAFYAFSPLAGGLLAKPLDQILKPAKGTRYDSMAVFRDGYLKQHILDALRTLRAACEQNGQVTIMEATLRWFMHHSPLRKEDAFILGASRTDQIEASLAACQKPPLPGPLVEAFEEAWRKSEANPMS